ncbi:MAG: hypothetical protein IJ511_03790 [Bacteroides sp.]|nr:hypothetical protein [Bacteroides sp.]
MKQLKFFMFALTVLMGVSFTSCLDSDDSEYNSVGLFRVMTGYSGSYFMDLVGNQLYPTYSSVLEIEEQLGGPISAYDLAYIQYSYVEETTTRAESSTTPQVYNIKLLGFVGYTATLTETISSEEEVGDLSSNEVPFVSLTPSGSNGYGYNYTNYPATYGKLYLLAPIAFMTTNDEEKFKQHSFHLAFIPANVQSGDTELVFYMSHDAGSDDMSTSPVTTSGTKIFDIQSALMNFQAKTGAYPKKITIKAKVNENSTTLPDEFTSVSIDCNFD